jgi:hypothetical protein
VTRGRSPARRRGSGGGKPARRTPGRWGRMCDAWAWTDETNGTRGEKKKFWPAGGGSVLTGSGGEGGPEGWTPRGGGAGEGERGGGRRATVENDGVGATRVNVADRWAETLRGPGHQRLGVARGSAVRRSARR